MSLQGSLETFYLTSLLRMLNYEQRTGKLTLRTKNNAVQIFFHEGDIIFATETRKNNRLGELLLEGGYISQSVLDECLTLSLKNKERLGKTLVQQGYIRLEKLNAFLLKQAENTVYNALLWDSGRFEYSDVELNLQGAIEYKLSTMSVLLEASRRVEEIEVIKRHIPSETAILKITVNTGSGEEIKLSNYEWRILSLVDGIFTVREVIDKSGFDDIAAYKILNSLISSGKVALSLPMTPEGLARAAVEKLRKIDSRQFREALDHLGLKRSSILRAILARIFREAISEKQIQASAQKEAEKIKNLSEKKALNQLREENRVPFMKEMIELLWQLNQGERQKVRHAAVSVQ